MRISEEKGGLERRVGKNIKLLLRKKNKKTPNDGIDVD
jgi:hypothetical protein